VPGDPLGVAGELGEQVAVAQDHRVAQQVRDDVDDAAGNRPRSPGDPPLPTAWCRGLEARLLTGQSTGMEGGCDFVGLRSHPKSRVQSGRP